MRQFVTINLRKSREKRNAGGLNI